MQPFRACFSFLLAALLYNVGNLTLALRIILADAIQLNRYVFRYSGMGAMRAMAAGAWLCAGSFLLQAYSPYQAKGVEFPHPVFYSVYAQLRCSLMTAVQLLTGILILCFELESVGNAAVRWMLFGFLCFSACGDWNGFSHACGAVCAARQQWF